MTGLALEHLPDFSYLQFAISQILCNNTSPVRSVLKYLFKIGLVPAQTPMEGRFMAESNNILEGLFLFLTFIMFLQLQDFPVQII